MTPVPTMVDYLLDEAIHALEEGDRALAVTHLSDAVLKASCPKGSPVPIELAAKVRTIIRLGGSIDWRKPAA